MSPQDDPAVASLSSSELLTDPTIAFGQVATGASSFIISRAECQELRRHSRHRAIKPVEVEGRAALGALPDG
jgi:hypothetical protein